MKRLCQVLGVNRSNYYKWRDGADARTARRAADRALAAEIRAVHTDSDGAYGSPRITAELRADGRKINEKRGGPRDGQVLHPGHAPAQTGPHHDPRAVGDTGPGPVPAG
ncbi:IS3 family transposase [Streptomyces sp. NPDC052109]|uniref:IS3 family transposase n=1 Tax=Streptomyces sp. NPDC052109 TaxID=3155527 RepID=UPI0034278B3F